MKTFEVTLVGVSPMLQNPMTERTLDELESGVRTSLRKDRPREDVVREKVIVNNGYLGVPAEYLLACLIEAGRKVKNGKFNISTATSSTLPGFLSIRDEFLPFTHIENNGSFDWLETHKESGYPEGITEVPWIADRRRGVLDSGGKKVAVPIVRPKFPAGWTIKATIDIDEGENGCSPDTAKKLFEVAGRSIGLGDFRPAKRGPFGRALVSSWREVTKQSESNIVEAVSKNGKNGNADTKTAGVAAVA